jgi:CHAT domain-containing protein
MTNKRTKLKLKSKISNSDGLTRVNPFLDAIKRDGGFIIEIISLQENKIFKVIPMPDLFPFGAREWETRMPFSPETLFQNVQYCRAVWEEEIVKYSEKGLDKKGVFTNLALFQEEWDFSGKPKLFRERMAKLAKAGENLFSFIFESERKDILTQTQADTRRAVADRLKEVACDKERSLFITIQSDCCFVPWGMLYTHPNPDEKLDSNGSNFEPEGFWGYRHVIEHKTPHSNGDSRLQATKGGKIRASIYIDKNIDKELNVKCVALQLAFFKKQTCLELTKRFYKKKLEQDVSSEKFQEQIVYFYCHGEGAGEYKTPNLSDAKIALSDKQAITGLDITNWLKNRDLNPSPILFINACESGHMTTIFYETLAKEFLRRKAAGVIGAQITIPAVFADRYAQRFFEEFLKGSKKQAKGKEEKVRVGPLMRLLAREFIDKHNNPLGLVYSLYKGADCFVAR